MSGKAYISIIIDDNNDELERIFRLVTGEYGFPLCAAVPVHSLTARPESLALLREIEQSGGEILSHTLTHRVLNRTVLDEDIEKEICGSHAALTAHGFTVRGIILAGGGGTEDTDEEFRQKLEPYTARCYDYSDQYGVSPAYYHPRTWLPAGLAYVEKKIDEAVAQGAWLPIAAHAMTHDVGPISEGLWRDFVALLKRKQDAGVLAVVTYRTAHERGLI